MNRLHRNLIFGDFEVDLRTGELCKAGTRIKLQDQPFEILVALLENPRKLVTREELRQRIWPNGDFDHTVNIAIAKLRTALGDSVQAPHFIETLHRRGYRFKVPVSSALEVAVGEPSRGISRLAMQGERAEAGPALEWNRT